MLSPLPSKSRRRQHWTGILPIAIPIISLMPDGGGEAPVGPLPSPPSGDNETGFSLRNWWRNGPACRVTFILALIGLVHLFQPWQPDYLGAGYSTTNREGNEIVRRYYRGTEVKGGGNAFSEGHGWIPLTGFLAVLYVCGKPRRSMGAIRWVPVSAAILVLACVVDAQQQEKRQREEWLSRFFSRPVVTEPFAPRWVTIASLGMIISGAFLARRRSNGSPPPVPTHTA